MRFLFDESADLRLGHYLASLGHDISSIVRDQVPGLGDRAVLALARSQGRILLTEDRDFGDLVFHQREPHGGVIYLRLGNMSLVRKQGRLVDALQMLASRPDPLFLVVTTSVIREATGDSPAPSV